MKVRLFYKVILAFMFVSFSVSVSAQIKFYENNRLTIGNTTPYGSYYYTFVTTGMYLKCATSNFFQVDVTPAATRLASHGDQIVFYNTQTGAYNNIQVKNVYNYSDALAKKNILPSTYGMNVLSMLKPVTYFFSDNARSNTNLPEIGLLAQDVEEILPNVVMTDEDGKKLINYTALIPVLINESA